MVHCAGRTTLPPLALFFSFALPLFLCVSSVLLPVLPTFVFVRSSVSFRLLFFVRDLFPCVIRSSPGPPPVFCFLQCLFFSSPSSSPLPFSLAFSGFYKAGEWPFFTCSCLTIVRHERLCFFEKKQGQKICSPLSCSVSLFLCMSWVVFFFVSPRFSFFSLLLPREVAFVQAL
jgi:hypothetical protein